MKLELESSLNAKYCWMESFPVWKVRHCCGDTMRRLHPSLPLLSGIGVCSRGEIDLQGIGAGVLTTFPAYNDGREKLS